MADFLMPSLGADMEHGKLVEWLVKPGDYVRRGDLVAVVDTDKTVMDVESFEEGVVSELLIDVGQSVPVGTPLARITQTPAEVEPPRAPSARIPAAAEPPRAPSKRTAAAAGPSRATPSAAASPATVPITPPVRHLAHRLGVDTGTIRGTGKHGAITRADVEHAQSEQVSAEHARPSGGRVRSSPLARRLAAQLGVDLASITGTGPDGAVTAADVERGAEARPAADEAAGASQSQAVDHQPRRPAGTPPEAPPDAPPGPAAAARERVASLRRAVGALMVRSKQTIPHYYLSTTLDLRAAVTWMQSVNTQRPVASRLIPSVLLFKAAALAARDVPEVNGFYDDGGFRPSAAVHLGVAVALRQGGLVAPAIHDADTLSVDELMRQLQDLVARARAGRLQRAEMADPTVTVTNLGELGVDSVFGVIYPPQVAMVGFGRVTEQPWAQDGLLGVRPAVIATLSADHRVSDGLRGARYLARIEELLQKPEEL